MTGDEEQAREFTQETFVRAFSRLAHFRGEASLATWLNRITVSVTLNGLRQVRRLRQREADLAGEYAADDGPETGCDPDLRAALHREIDRLPELYRTVFVMHDVEGYTHEEIGAALEVAEGTSKARLSRARARLRAALVRFRSASV